MIPAIFILALCTTISTPTAKLEEREEDFVCTTGGVTGPGGIIFFSIFSCCVGEIYYLEQ